MSTRSCVAKREGDGWVGRYVHFDGYPSGVGCDLLARREKLGSVEEMIAHYVDDEPAGWSNLDESYSSRGETEPMLIRSTDKDFPGTEWVYILDDAGIEVWEGAMGMFGMGGGKFCRRGFVPWGDFETMKALGGE